MNLLAALRKTRGLPLVHQEPFDGQRQQPERQREERNNQGEGSGDAAWQLLIVDVVAHSYSPWPFAPSGELLK
jgi:hypothetical protein